MLREQTGDHWNLVDGKYVGVSYKTEEQQEAERKVAEAKKKEEKWKELLAKVKGQSLDELVKLLGMASHHASAARGMPPMKTGTEAYKWIGETFGLTSENDCETAVSVAIESKLMVIDYDTEGRLECFRGVNTKTPSA